MKQIILRVLAPIVVVLVILFAVYTVLGTQNNPHTDAAEIAAPIVKVSTTVPGRVVEVMVHNNDYVEAGDVLFRVDPEPYELEVKQMQATLTTAISELAQGQRNLDLERSNAQVAAEQINRARNNLALAQATLERLQPLLEQGYVTEQEVETARTGVSDAQVTLQQALSHAQGTSDFIGTLDTRQAQVDLARASLALAERNLRNTEFRAPIAGRVTGLVLNAGEYVVTGTPLFSLIDTSHWHASALFRETDLPEIEVGAKAWVYLLAAPDQVLEGRVTSIGWAIKSTEEAQIFGLPVVMNRIDWIRTARRFPVEIQLIDPPADLIRVGMSASVRVLAGDEDDAGAGEGHGE